MKQQQSIDPWWSQACRWRHHDATLNHAVRELRYIIIYMKVRGSDSIRGSEQEVPERDIWLSPQAHVHRSTCTGLGLQFTDWLTWGFYRRVWCDEGSGHLRRVSDAAVKCVVNISYTAERKATLNWNEALEGRARQSALLLQESQLKWIVFQHKKKWRNAGVSSAYDLFKPEINIQLLRRLTLQQIKGNKLV